VTGILSAVDGQNRKSVTKNGAFALTGRFFREYFVMIQFGYEKDNHELQKIAARRNAACRLKSRMIFL
jgi:hypothetical protein